jgi:hypothetical protein
VQSRRGIDGCREGPALSLQTNRRSPSVQSGEPPEQLGLLVRKLAFRRRWLVDIAADMLNELTAGIEGRTCG